MNGGIDHSNDTLLPAVVVQQHLAAQRVSRVDRRPATIRCRRSRASAASTACARESRRARRRPARRRIARHPAAIIGRTIALLPGGSRGGSTHTSVRSAPVNTATTPAWRRHRSRRSTQSRPCGSIDRTNDRVKRTVELGQAQAVDERALPAQQRPRPRGDGFVAARRSHPRICHTVGHFQSLADAIRAPSASAWNFGHTTVGCTSGA